MPVKKPASRKRKNQTAPTSTTNGRLEVISSKMVFKGRVFHVTADRVQEPSGIVAWREIIRHSGSAVILAVDDSKSDPRVLLERQYRYAARDYLWELPAGRVDPGERPLAGAKRELLEETGFRARRWQRALFFYPSPGFLDETMSVYLARDLAAGKASPEADESIQWTLLPLSQVTDMVFSGEIRDGKTIASVLWLKEFLRREPSGA